MLTGELRSRIDGVWNAFWAGGIANPLEVIEQITYLLFMRGLDEAHTREENKANRLGKPIERRIFPTGKDKIGKNGGIAYEDMRWSRLKNRDPATMFEIVSEHVFPFLRSMADANTAHATHMKGARFTIPTPALLAKVVDLLAEIPMEDRDTKGDLYEYMLSKIATAGQNGQFRTPRHIIALMVEMMAPSPKDVICDPACGTCGFLIAAGEYLRENHPKLFQEKASREHFHEEMFHGFDFDGTMLRIYDGKIVDLLSLRRLSVTDSELSRFKLTNDDIVINRVNSLEYLGKSAIVRGLLEPTVYESNMMRVSVKKSIMLPEVCIALLQTPDTKRQILAKAKNAVNQSSINQRDVCSLHLALPTMEIQQKFVARAQRVSALVAIASASEASLNTLFSSLQHRAFSGQL